MNPEFKNFHSAEDTFDKLSSLTKNDRIKETLLPALIAVSDNSNSTQELVDKIIETVSIFADEHMNGMRVIALNKIPEYIDILVVDFEDKREALSIWYAFVIEQKSKEQKLPRKLKKALAKSAAKRTPGEREKAEKFSRRFDK